MFRQKMLLSFVGLAVMACGFLGVASYMVSLRLQQESIEKYYSQLLVQVSMDVNARLQSIENTAHFLAADTNLQRTLMVKMEGYDVVEFHEFIGRYSVPLIHLMPITGHIRIYAANETLPERYYVYSNDQLRKNPSILIRYLDIRKYQKLMEEDWFHQIKDLSLHEPIWLQVSDDSEKRHVSLLFNIHDLENYLIKSTQDVRLALVRITVNLSDLIHIAPISEGGSHVLFALVDNEDRILYAHPQSSQSTSEQTTVMNGGKTFFVLEQPLHTMGMRIRAYVPVHAIKAEARRVWGLTTVITLSCMMVFAIVGFFFSRYFGGCIRKIVDFIDAFRDGGFKQRLTIGTRDELYTISVALNDMAETIDKLVHEVYLVNLEKTGAELQLLQSQMNPHLLYNSLNSISNFIQLKMQDKALTIIDAMTKFYKLSLTCGTMIVPVMEEIEHVRAYIDVKSIQFNDLVQVHYHIDQEVYNLFTLKIVLQPLVENVFKHAMYMNREVQIDISAFMEGDTLVFKVADDGIGIAPEQVCRLNRGDSDGQGMGLYNTIQRIRLKFGMDYGILIDSRPAKGTCVTVRQPISTLPLT